MNSSNYFHNQPPRSKIVLDVGHDLDGCHFRFERSWYNAAAILGHLNPGAQPFIESRTWAFYEAYGMDAERFLKVCNQAADEGLLWCGPVMPGGKDAWLDIAADGHRIHVKTDRSFGADPVVSEVATRIWLRSNGLPYDTLTFTADKTQGPRCDVMIEDKLANYDALDAAGVQVWLLDQAWNQDDGTRRRMFSHDEWLTRVRYLASVKAAEGVSA